MGTILVDLTTDAQVTYSNGNGTYTFGPGANILRVSHRPIYDQAKRTVTHTVHTFVLEDILQTQDQTDGVKVDTTAIRRILNYPGGELTVQGVGVGSFAVNIGPLSALGVPNNSFIVYDCLWGPLPTELAWENYGNGKAGKIVWQVTCATPEQCANAASQRDVMAYNYDAVFTKDKSGYGRRVVTGYVEIPITRINPGDRTVPDNVDRLRESCYPSIAIGWMRTNDSWKVSMDRRRADFNYTDEEQPPNAPAQGVVICEEKQSSESGANLLARWTTTLSGTYEMAKARQRAESWTHFTRFCRDRIQAIIRGVANNANVVGPVDCAIIPIKLRLGEPIHTRMSGEFSLVLQYTLPAAGIGAVLRNAVAASGLFTPLSDSNYTNWRTTMLQAGVFTARGAANTSFLNNANTDTIIDLCLNANPTVLSSNDITIRAGPLGPATIVLPPPAPSGSFLDYRVGMHVEDFDSVAELKPLPTSPILYTGDGGNTLTTIANAGSGGIVSTTGFMPAYPNTPTSVLQDRSGTHTSVVVFGAALRAGYMVTPPQLQLIGGVVPRRQNREGTFFRQWLWGDFGIPIYAAVWAQRYILPSQPSQYLPVDNPLYGRALTTNTLRTG